MSLRPGDVVLVRGEMGAGKTTFVRGACRALGVTGPVTSPTFTIGQRYEGRDGPVAHIDLHRLESLAGEDPGLLADYLEPGVIAFVEWPEIGDFDARFDVIIHHGGGDERHIQVVRN